MLDGKKTPYTAKQIAKAKCGRCGEPAAFQWQVCADDKTYRPICRACDLHLNRLFLEMIHAPDIETKMKQYEEATNA